MQNYIVKTADGEVAILFEGRIYSLFEDKSIPAPVKRDIVGYIEFSEKFNTHHYSPESVHRTIFQVFLNDNPDKEAFLINTNHSPEGTTFVRLTDSVLMGYLPVGNSKYNYANVFYYQAVGEVQGFPIYAYMHDMVIGETQTKWVTRKGEKTVPHVST